MFGFSVCLTDVLTDAGVSDKQVTLLTCDFQLNAAVLVTVITDVKKKNRKRLHSCPHECLFF